MLLGIDLSALLGVDPLVLWGGISFLFCFEFVAKPLILRRMMRGYYERKALSAAKGSEPKALSASTGCELTDKIFAAADKAGLSPCEEIGSLVPGSQED